MATDVGNAIDEARGLVGRAGGEGAIARIRSLAERGKRSAELWKLLGEALLSVGQEEEAIQAFLQSTWLISKDADVWVSMAICAHRLGRQKDAMQYWKSAVMAHPRLFRERPALATLWAECRGTGERYAEIVKRLEARTDERSASTLLELVLTTDDIAVALATLANAKELSPPLALARIVLECVADETCQPVLPMDPDGHSIQATFDVDDAFMMECINRAAGLSGLDADTILARLARSTGSRLARRVYAMAGRESEAVLVALVMMMRGLAATDHRVEARV